MKRSTAPNQAQAGLPLKVVVPLNACVVGEPGVARVVAFDPAPPQDLEQRVIDAFEVHGFAGAGPGYRIWTGRIEADAARAELIGQVRELVAKTKSLATCVRVARVTVYLPPRRGLQPSSASR